jgi:hypothetical protein
MAFCKLSWSSTSRFLFNKRVSFLGRPLGLDFRPSVGGAIIHGVVEGGVKFRD